MYAPTVRINKHFACFGKYKRDRDPCTSSVSLFRESRVGPALQRRHRCSFSAAVIVSGSPLFPFTVYQLPARLDYDPRIYRHFMGFITSTYDDGIQQTRPYISRPDQNSFRQRNKLDPFRFNFGAQSQFEERGASTSFFFLFLSAYLFAFYFIKSRVYNK